jgi:ATP-dependent RNA helicase MSS116
MYGAMRRCPAMLSRSLSTAAISFKCTRTPLSQPIRARGTPSRFTNVSTAGFHHSAKWQQIAAAEEEAGQDAPTAAPVTEFADLAVLGLVHPNIINTITKQMRLKTMTEVQTRTINEALSGNDVYDTQIPREDMS